MGTTTASAEDERNDFNDALAALQRSSETSRAIFSTFFIIYAAIAMFTLSAFVVPHEADRIHDLSDDLTRAVPCIFYDPQTIEDSKIKCDGDYSNIVMSPKEFKGFETNIKTSDQVKYREILQTANTDIFKQRIIKMLDDSDESSRFSVPIVGAKIDRNWFGYINAVGDAFFLFIVLHTVENQIVLLHFVRHGFNSTLLRLHQINATQVFTSSGRFPGYISKHKSRTGWYTHVIPILIARSNKMLFLGILSCPLFVALAVEWDTLHILFPHHWPYLPNVPPWLATLGSANPVSLLSATDKVSSTDPERLHRDAKDHFLFFILLIFNSVAILAMLVLVARLRRRVWRLFDDDDENMVKIEHLEAERRAGSVPR